MLDQNLKLMVSNDIFEIIIDYFLKNVQTNFLNKFSFKDDAHTEISSELNHFAATDIKYQEELFDYSYGFFKTLETHEKTALYLYTIYNNTNVFEQMFKEDLTEDEVVKLFSEGKYDEEFGKYIESLLNNHENETLIDLSLKQLKDILINFCSEFDLHDYDEDLKTINQTILNYQKVIPLLL